MAEIKEVDIDQIKIDVDEIQPRLGLDEGRVEILCEKYQAERLEAFPPIIVYRESDNVLWLADGHYRLAAVREALSLEDPRVIRAEVREGSKREAGFFAAGANRAHGSQLTGEEMRRLVERLLRDPEWRQMSDRQIALYIGASNGFVSKIHRELDAHDASVHGTQVPTTRTVKGRRGGKDLNMTIDKARHGRGSKAKTATPITVADNSAEAPEQPHRYEAAERNIDANQDAVRINTATPTISAEAQDEHRADEDDKGTTDDDQEAGDTQGYLDLVAAWFNATTQERFQFLEMLRTHKQQEDWEEVAQAAEVVRQQLALSNEEMR
jgi:hypothetical protein